MKGKDFIKLNPDVQLNGWIGKSHRDPGIVALFCSVVPFNDLFYLAFGCVGAMILWKLFAQWLHRRMAWMNEWMSSKPEYECMDSNLPYFEIPKEEMIDE